MPAGTYSGAAGNPDAITVENAAGIRGARGPSYFLINMRGGYRIRLPHGRKLQAHVDVFNVTKLSRPFMQEIPFVVLRTSYFLFLTL